MIRVPPAMVLRFGISFRRIAARTIPYRGSREVIMLTVVALSSFRDEIKRVWARAVQKIPSPAIKKISFMDGSSLDTDMSRGRIARDAKAFWWNATLMGKSKLRFFLLKIARRAKVSPEMVPQKAPWTGFCEKSNEGRIRITPANTRRATLMSVVLSFSLKKSGSRKVTKMGKVEKVRRPRATVDICIERKNVLQWMARRAPWRI